MVFHKAAGPVSEAWLSTLPFVQYLFREYCGRQPGTPDALKLTVGEVNRYLDQLAGDEANAGKVRVLRDLLQVTTSNQMKWIVQILLRDLKVYSAPDSSSQKACLACCCEAMAYVQGCYRHPLPKAAMSLQKFGLLSS